ASVRARDRAGRAWASAPCWAGASPGYARQRLRRAMGAAFWPGRKAALPALRALPARSANLRSASLHSFRLAVRLGIFSGVEFLELPQDLVAALDGVIHRLLRLLLAGEHRFHLVALRQHRLHEITEAEPARIVVGRAAGE